MEPDRSGQGGQVDLDAAPSDPEVTLWRNSGRDDVEREADLEVVAAGESQGGANTSHPS